MSMHGSQRAFVRARTGPSNSRRCSASAAAPWPRWSGPRLCPWTGSAAGSVSTKRPADASSVRRSLSSSRSRPLPGESTAGASRAGPGRRTSSPCCARSLPSSRPSTPARSCRCFRFFLRQIGTRSLQGFASRISMEWRLCWPSILLSAQRRKAQRFRRVRASVRPWRDWRRISIFSRITLLPEEPRITGFCPAQGRQAVGRSWPTIRTSLPPSRLPGTCFISGLRSGPWQAPPWSARPESASDTMATEPGGLRPG